MRYKDIGRHQASWFTQLIGMLRRQVTIKARDRRRTFSEIVLPLYSLSLLIILKLAVPNPNYRAENASPQPLAFVKDVEALYKKGNDSSIAVVPNSPQTQTFIAEMVAFYESVSRSGSNKTATKSPDWMRFRLFNSDEELLQFYYKKSVSIAYAIVFYQINSTINYQIRSNPSVHHTPPTSDLFSPPSACRHQESQMVQAFKKSHLGAVSTGDNGTEEANPFFKMDTNECPAQQYVTKSFLALQAWIDGTHLRSLYNEKYQLPAVQLQQFPKAAFTGDWLLGLRLVIPIYIVMSLSQFLTYLIITVVGEKENNLKEGMRIMGLRDPAYWFSYFCMYAVIVTFHSSLTAFLLWWLQVFQHTNMAILYLLLISYSFSLIMFSFFLTPFFDKASSAGIVASFAVNIISLLYFLQVFLAKSPTCVFWLISFMSSAGFALAMDKALVMELSGEGVQWSNLWSNPSQIGLSFGSSLVMMFVDIVLYGTLAYYLDNVLPSKYGNSKSPLFFLKASFWSEKHIRQNRQREDYVKYNANVNAMFTDDCDGFNLTNHVIKDETEKDLDSPVNVIITSESIPKNEANNDFFVNLEEAKKDLSKSNGDLCKLNQNPSEHSESKQDSCESKLNFLPNYGIVAKKGSINLNNTFPLNTAEDLKLDHASQDIYDSEQTHMEIVFAPLKSNRTTSKAESNGTSQKRSHQDDIEPVSSELIGREAIVIENLSKEFGGCRKPTTTALENIHLTIYEGQITAILGHNGAGKTTLFNILTGLTLPTAGHAWVYGYDVTDPDGMALIRRIIGVCPQSDLLFHLLSPQEHLEFYAHLKGIPKAQRRREINRTLQDVDLSDKATVLTKYLSGGQRRKLSVAIAILGDPKIIILDEPTAGIDPYSRRHMWSILQKMRQGRVILLTTHFMDEADILADRKAVISKGRIRCCGSSLFLKNKFGVGYHLTLVLDTESDEDAIAVLIYHHIPTAEKTRRHGKELAYILPYNAVDKFAVLFAAIEEEIKKKELGITTYGVSMTSLEEVFLQLEKDEEENDSKTVIPIQNTAKNIARNKRKNKKQRNKYAALENESHVDGNADNPEGDAKSKPDGTDKIATGIGHELITTDRSTWKVFVAITKLRLIRLGRDVQKLYIMLVIPLVFAGIGMYMHRSGNNEFENKPVNLSQYVYKDSYTIAVNVANSTEGRSFFALFDNSSTLSYNGSYASLLAYNRTKPLLGAFNVHSLANFTIVYNDTCTHALPVLLNVLDNVLERYLKTNNSKVIKSNKTDLPLSQRYRKRPISTGPLLYSSIRAEVRPLPMTSLTPNFNTGLFSMSLFLGMVFVLIPVNMSVELVMDRENKSKNQLRVNGLGAVIYFLSHFLILILLILIVYVGLLGLIFTFNLSFLKSRTSFLVMGTLISMATPSLILFCTCLSYLFKRTSSARSIMPNIVTLFAFIPFVMVSCCHMYSIGNGLYHRLHAFFCLVDTIYIPYSIIYFMDMVHIQCELRNNCSSLSFTDYLLTPDLKTIMLCSLAQIPILFAILLYLDAKAGGTKHTDIFRHLFGKSRLLSAEEYYDGEREEGEEGDEDVRKEKMKVKDIVQCNVLYNQPVVLLQNLTKVYNKGLDKKKSRDIRRKEKVAVQNLNLCIDQGEVFGLLGHNGAGKTTTLKIITYEEMPTSGMVQIGGHNVTTNFGSAFQLLGYCPQHNALWYNVTLREHMETYAAIRGVPKFDIPRLVNSFIDGLHIAEHADKEVMECSGGTKRKLSYALAMIGNPRIVLLDEPSTGMDPKSKRFLWDTILASFQGSRGAVLTTHSMEEADALCSRVGIMVKGQLRCVGSTQHLKNRYGAGYTLEIKMQMTSSHLFREDSNLHSRESHFPTVQNSYLPINSTMITPPSQGDKAGQIKSLVGQLFNNQALLGEEFVDRLVFSIPQDAVTSLANIFVALEQAKKDLSIEEYSFSQTTLEQVYLKFAQNNGDQIVTDD